MKLSRSDVKLLGEGLDHCECVCIGSNGEIIAGGEAGQVYRIASDGSGQEVIANTHGFLLGVAVDGHGHVHACDIGKRTVWEINPTGEMRLRSTGAPNHPFTVPNFPAFDRHGNLYVSDSGDYWNPQGDGCVLKIDPQGLTTVFHRGPFLFANGLAIDPTEKWLYVVQSTASNVVRIPLDEPDRPAVLTHQLPSGTVPDGIAFAADGRLVIGCYKPDALFLGNPDGHVELLYDDPTGELLNRPTNVVIGEGKLYIANLGGWHLTSLPTDLVAAPLHRPLMLK